MNSNWTDSAGVAYSAQNDYNWAFANASARYNVSTWILKAIAANESSFSPYASNELKAVGLSGMTGNGVSFVLENINKEDDYFNGQIENIYNWLTAPTRYPNIGEYQRKVDQGETYIQWYRRVLGEGKVKETADGKCPDLNVDTSDEALACNLAWQTRSKFIEMIDGRDANYPPVELPPSDVLNQEVLDNLTISAAHLSVAQQETKRKTTVEQWDNITEKDRLLLTLSVYNTGGDSQMMGIIEEVVSQGGKPEWAVIRPLMLDAGLLGTVTYAEEILAHAEQGGN